MRSRITDTGRVGRNTNHLGQALAVLSMARTQ